MRHGRFLRIILIAVSVIFPSCARALPQGTETHAEMLGAVSLELGAAQDEVLTKLKALYSLSDPTEGTYSVLERSGPRLEDRAHLVGDVHFEAGRLDRITKQWGESDSQDAIRLVESLYSMLSTRLPEDDSVIVWTQEFSEPDYKSKSVLISDHAAGRRFSLDVYDNHGTRFVRVEEVLHPAPAASSTTAPKKPSKPRSPKPKRR
jgi:hypothetical protein